MVFSYPSRSDFGLNMVLVGVVLNNLRREGGFIDNDRIRETESAF